MAYLGKQISRHQVIPLAHSLEEEVLEVTPHSGTSLAQSTTVQQSTSPASAEAKQRTFRLSSLLGLNSVS